MLDLLAVVARRWRAVVAMVIIGITAASAVTYVVTPTYRASTQLFVALDSADNAIELNSAASFSSQRVKSYPGLVDSPLVLDPVIEELGLETSPSELARSVQAEVLPNTVLIQVFADDTSPVRAAEVANAVAVNLAAVVEELDRTRDDRTSPVRVSVTRQATPPRSPRTPIPALNLALGLLIGLGLGLLWAAVREALDTSVKNEADALDASGLPTLAQVPTNSRVSQGPIIEHSQPSENPVWAESYRKLRTNLSYVDPDNPPEVIMVASALPGDGKTLTAANLAASLAQSGRRTVLVEADLRRPSLAGLLGVDNEIGVTTVVTGRTTLDDALQRSDVFEVLVSGPIPPNPSELLGSQAFAAMMRTLRDRYDAVIIDTPPLVAVTDAAVVSSITDTVVVVVRAKRTKRADLRKALYSLRAVEANVAGIVLNQVKLNAMSYYQYDYQPATPERSDGRRGRRPTTQAVGEPSGEGADVAAKSDRDH